MKKSLLALILITMCLSVTMLPVNATTVNHATTVDAITTKTVTTTKTNVGQITKMNNNTNNSNTNTGGYSQGTVVKAGCNGIFTNEAIELISEILGYFQILAPIVLILLVAVDFSKAVISQDDKEIKKASGTAVKRGLAAIGLFLVPMMVRVLLNFGPVRDMLSETGIVDNPTCGALDS